jgi:hypothetical protein
MTVSGASAECPFPAPAELGNACMECMMFHVEQYNSPGVVGLGELEP